MPKQPNLIVDDHPRCSTGIAGLDEILGGGLPAQSFYSVQGEPGSGKTTFALQFLQEGIRRGERALYITFSETKFELTRVARSHGWDISGIHVMDLTSLEESLAPEAQSTLFHPSEIELNQVSELILAKIREVKPARIAFDSVSEMRLLSESALLYRRQILALKQELAQHQSTVLFLDDLTVDAKELQIHSIAHGVVQLSRLNREYGIERRRLRVVKLRGVNFISGNHDFEILTGGMVVHPRIRVAASVKDVKTSVLKSGSRELDLLLGGGLDSGTANLVVGPAGTGKSTLIMKYALAAAAAGKKVAYFCFDETLANLRRRCRALDIDVNAVEASGMLRLQAVDPAEMSPGAFAGTIQDLVKHHDFEVVVIDSVNGYIQAMPQEQFLTLQLHELLAYLNNCGVVTIMTLAQVGMLGHMPSVVDLSYLADTVIMTRFFEASGAIRKAVSVIKKRTGTHEGTIREFSIGHGGLHVGKVLNDFQGVLTGVPKFTGDVENLQES